MSEPEKFNLRTKRSMPFGLLIDCMQEQFKLDFTYMATPPPFYTRSDLKTLYASILIISFVIDVFSQISVMAIISASVILKNPFY